MVKVETERISEGQLSKLDEIEKQVNYLETEGYNVHVVFSGDGKRGRMGQVTVSSGGQQMYASAFYTLKGAIDYLDIVIVEVNTPFKPDWRDAPPWANYWAKDSDGRCYWHSHPIFTKEDRWESKAYATEVEAYRPSKYHPREIYKAQRLNWKDSLRKRKE